jgi:hypothetical protein
MYVFIGSAIFVFAALSARLSHFLKFAHQQNPRSCLPRGRRRGPNLLFSRRRHGDGLKPPVKLGAKYCRFVPANTNGQPFKLQQIFLN